MDQRILQAPDSRTAEDVAVELRRLAALRELGILDTPQEAGFDDITALAAQICDAPVAMVCLVDENRLWFKSRHGPGPRQVPRQGSICNHVIRRDGLVEVEDTLAAGVDPAVVTLSGGRVLRFYAGVPLQLSEGHNVGVLCVLDDEPRRLSPAQSEGLLRLGRQAAAALEARQRAAMLLDAQRQIERRAHFNAIHARASQVIASSEDIRPMLQAICDVAVEHSGIRLAFVSRPNGEGVFEFPASAGATAYLRGLRLAMEPSDSHLVGPTSIVWRTGEPFFAGSFDAAPELQPFQARGRRHGFRSSATVPIFRAGKVWATFTAHHAEENAFDTESQEILSELTLDVSRGLDRLDAAQREHELVELQRTLLDNTLAGILIKRDRRIVSANRRFAHMLGYESPEALIGLSTRIMYPDAAEFDRVHRLYPRLLRDGHVHAMDVRIHRRDGAEVLCDVAAGAIGHGSERTTVWTFVDVTERARLQRKLTHDALHDTLSGLPNRRALEDYLPRSLARAQRRNRAVAVGVVDLDDFKPVNDTFGHEAGDELLREFARRMTALMRKSDMLVRLGGDEFVLILEDLEPSGLRAHIERLSRRLRRAVETPFVIGQGQEASVGMTLGIAVFPRDGGDTDALLRQADAALYQLKAHKIDRPSWWQLGVQSEPDSDENADGFEVYGAAADAFLNRYGATLREAIPRFIDQLLEELAGEPARTGVLRSLGEGELQRLARSYAEHLGRIVSAGASSEALSLRAGKIGQIQALTGIEPAQLIAPMGMLRRIAMEHAISARISASTRYRLLRLLEDRLQDDLQGQLRGASRTAGAYFQSLTSETEPLPGMPWRDALAGLIDPVGAAPGILACVVLRPDMFDKFEIEAAAGPLADKLAATMGAAELSISLHDLRQHACGLIAHAWHTHEVQGSADLQRDERLVRWHALASAASVRSAVAIPVAPNPGRCSMVIVLLGAYPNQFEAPWMRQFIRGLQSRASHTWRTARAPSSSLVISKRMAQLYRGRLLDGGLHMYLQPVVDLHTGACVKAEALARLHLEDGRVLSPAQFLPILGEAELDRLFRDGLEQILAQVRQWDEQGTRVDVGINLPPTSLLSPACPRWVESALSRHGIEPSRLTLELLETQDVDFQIHVAAVRSLKDLGVRLAMDDLGAGYSSLQRLAQLPFDVIKLDQSLTLNMRRDPLQTLSLVRSIVRLAAELGRLLVVEAVEDLGVIEAVLECGARYGQGYGIARPMPSSTLLAWKRNFRLAARSGEIRTFLGMLARCSRLSQPTLHEAHRVGDDAVSRFLAGRGLSDSELARWYAQATVAGRLDSVGEADWMGWLVQQVRVETTEE